MSTLKIGNLNIKNSAICNSTKKQELPRKKSNKICMLKVQNTDEINQRRPVMQIYCIHGMLRF